MKTLRLCLLLVLAAIAFLVAGKLLAQVPPAPGVSVLLSWDANPADEDVRLYIVREAAVITGPWAIVGITTNTNATVFLPSPRQGFWYVTASNFWGEGPPSTTNHTPAPAGLVERVTLTR